MVEIRDWRAHRERLIRLLEERTGETLDTWNRRVRRSGAKDEKSLRAWLAERGVDGYPRQLLVMERFGYPDWALAPADALVDAQYADRQALRPIYDAVIAAARGLGDVTVQARKTYVSLVGRRRTFARVQATTRSRVDLGFRIDGRAPRGRLVPAKIHDTLTVQVGLASPDEVDDKVVALLREAYEESR